MRVASCAAIHDRHHQVDQGKVDGVGLPEHLDGDASVLRCKHPVIHRLQRADRQLPDSGIIIHDEDRGGLSVMRNRPGLFNHPR